jgi:hypothetical protein
MRLPQLVSAVVLAVSPCSVAQSPAPPPPAAGPAATPPAQGLAQVRGVLLEPAGTPAVRHQLALRADNGDLFTSGPSGMDGAFVVPGIPPGTYKAAAFGPDGSEFPVLGGAVTLTGGQVLRQEFRIAGEGTAPGRAAPAEPGGKSGFARFAGSTAGKVTFALAGAAAIGLVIAGSGDDDPQPVSPSQP